MTTARNSPIRAIIPLDLLAAKALTIKNKLEVNYMTSLEYDELCSNNHKIKNLYHSVLSHDTAVVMCNSLDKLTFKKFVQSTLDPFTFRKWALDEGFLSEMSELHCWAQFDPQPFTTWIELLLTKKISDKHERIAADPNADVQYFNNSIRRLSKICMEAFNE